MFFQLQLALRHIGCVATTYVRSRRPPRACLFESIPPAYRILVKRQVTISYVFCLFVQNMLLDFLQNLPDNGYMIKNERTKTILEWSATAFTVAGAVATAIAIDPLNIYLLNLGAVLWLIWAVMVKRTSLIVVNAALLTVYVYGFILRMI